jgi:hypothetical protein
MKYRETEIQQYIWEHRDKLYSMIENPIFEAEPIKKPWEYEPWELLYYKALKEYEYSYELLKDLELFGCEVRLEKEGENTIRTDLLGCIGGANGLVVCELKVNRPPERQAYTELFAYANHVRGKLPPMGRRDIIYLLISPMEERIVREATINNLLYDKNRVLALIPQIEGDIDTLKFKLWIPQKKDFQIFAKTTFAFENIDVFKICWRGAEGKWSPTEKGKKPNSKMIHLLNKVSHYAAQLMEDRGVNGFVYCLQSYPEVRDWGFMENGLVLGGINPFKSAKTRFLYEKYGNMKEAAEAGMETLKVEDVFHNMRNSCDDESFLCMAEGWGACLDEIAFDVVDLVNKTFGPAYFEKDKGDFTWDTYLNHSSEDELCWNYDISLTGLFREIYHLKLERHYDAIKNYNSEVKGYIIDNHLLEWHCIDMMYSQDHIRSFIGGLIGYEKN